MELDGIKIAYLCLQATTEGQASYAHVHEIIDGLRGLGAHVDLFEPSYVGGKAPGAIGRFFEFHKVQKRLRNVLREYDLLYVRSHALARPSSIAAKRLGIPVVQECNGMVDDFFIAWPASRSVAPLITSWTLSQFREATALIAGSDGLASWLKENAGREAFVVPNGANIDLFKPIERNDWPASLKRLKLPHAYAIFFGSLAPWQGIHSILDAFALPEWPEEVDLVVVGGGKEAPAVAEAARHNQRIRYLGSLPYGELQPLVSGAVCSLIIKEQPEFERAGISPLKLYESLACGIPVVGTTNMPGLTEVIEDHHLGLTVPQYSPISVAEAVATLWSSPSLVEEMGQQARRFVEENGSWEVRSRQTAQILLEVLDR